MKHEFFSVVLGLVVAACGSNGTTSANGQTSDGGLVDDDGGSGTGASTDGGGGGNKSDASLGGGGGDSGTGGTTQDDGGTDDDSGTGGGGTTTTVPLRGTHTTNNTLMVNGAARTYDLTVPNTCVAATKVPLVFLFHADEGRGSDIYNGFPLEEAAAVAGQDAVYVYPNGQDDNDNGSAWNIYDDPGAYPYTKASPTGNQDVDYFDAMVASFASTIACADTGHVFITGFSNGGYMSEQLARWRASVVKASAPQSGGSPSGTQPSDYPTDGCPGRTGSVAVMIIHGQSDNVVDPCLGAQDVSYWNIANACANAADNCTDTQAECGGDLANPPVTATTAAMPSPCVLSNGCKAGAPVYYCSIPGMGHDIWSSAPTAIWTFFASLEGN